MKTNDRHEDTALRRVMEKQAQQAGKMQLPEDFADRVMNRIARQADGETVSTPSPAPARLTHLRKVAAILIAGIFISGLAFATWKLSNGHSQQKHRNPLQRHAGQHRHFRGGYAVFDR